MWEKYRTTILRILSLLVVVAISVWIFSIRDQTEHLATFGYPGIFFISILANATVILPAPGIALVYTFGAVLNPLFVGIVAGIGSGLGELSGYLAGYSGQGLITKTAAYNKIHPFIKKYGGGAIFVLSIIPNPFFDLAGIASGALKIKVGDFLVWCIAGKIIKMLIFAYAGAYSIDWLKNIL